YDLAYNAMNTVQDAYPDAKIELVKLKDEDFHFLADPNLIDLALTNLVENAAKYSPVPADITITLDHEGGEYKVSISDKGMGIPKEELENIFIRFYRVEKSRAKKIGGTGLGLSIVETIIDKHFGRITVDSEVGKGSTFTVYLPMRRGEV
ncbi:MAG: sensor histidine kinase, partial [Waddliaceae bacterium]